MARHHRDLITGHINMCTDNEVLAKHREILN